MTRPPRDRSRGFVPALDVSALVLDGWWLVPGRLPEDVIGGALCLRGRDDGEAPVVAERA